MRLVDLDPHWLLKDGKEVGFVFKSPTDPKWYQSCFFNSTPLHDQIDLIEAQGIENYQCCEQGCAWSHTTEDFETITITPSLDGSRGSLWHGFITSGQIVGGI